MTPDVLPCSSMNSVQLNNVSNSGHNARTRNRRNYETQAIGNTLALAVIQRFQQWCSQLFWLTIICVMGFCGDFEGMNNKQKVLEDVRRSLSANTKRSKSVMELEMQVS